MPAYPDDEEEGEAKDEHGNLHIRKPSGVTMVECLMEDLVPTSKRGETITEYM